MDPRVRLGWSYNPEDRTERLGPNRQTDQRTRSIYAIFSDVVLWDGRRPPQYSSPAYAEIHSVEVYPTAKMRTIMQSKTHIAQLF